MAVVAKQTVRVAGHRDMIRQGAVYQDDDLVVQQYPHLFEAPDEQARRLQSPRSTAELGSRSMSARKPRAQRQAETPGVETARQEPGEQRSIDYPCPVEGCDFSGTSERAVKTHQTKVHR